MIINFTNYYDQTQCLGLVPLLDYHGIPFAIRYAEIRETFTVLSRITEFTVEPRTIEFTVLPRITEFTVKPRTTEFTVLPRTTEFTVKE